MSARKFFERLKRVAPAFVLLVGILDHVKLDVLSVTVLSTHTLATGETVTLNGAEAVVLRGTKAP